MRAKRHYRSEKYVTKDMKRDGWRKSRSGKHEGEFVKTLCSKMRPKEVPSELTAWARACAAVRQVGEPFIPAKGTEQYDRVMKYYLSGPSPSPVAPPRKVGGKNKNKPIADEEVVPTPRRSARNKNKPIADEEVVPTPRRSARNKKQSNGKVAPSRRSKRATKAAPKKKATATKAAPKKKAVAKDWESMSLDAIRKRANDVYDGHQIQQQEGVPISRLSKKRIIAMFREDKSTFADYQKELADYEKKDKPWHTAVMRARDELGITGTVDIKKGSAVYNRAKELMA